MSFKQAAVGELPLVGLLYPEAHLNLPTPDHSSCATKLIKNGSTEPETELILGFGFTYFTLRMVGG